MKIAIIGAGNVGGTLGRRFAESGHTVTFGVRDQASDKAKALIALQAGTVTGIGEAVAGAEIVLLTVPSMALEESIEAAGDFTGKILVDCTNAVGKTFRPDTEPGTTLVENVARLAPTAHVVKAFNTIGWQVMAKPAFGDRSAVLPICGDDADAKAKVIELARSIGFDPIDAGPLEAAPLIENFAALWIGIAHRLGKGTEFAFGLLERSGQDESSET